MNFAQKLRILRKQFNFSQERLAEKLSVSRQAITKWATDGGLPDIENLMAVAALFSISMDELLSDEKLARAAAEYAYESVTEYDISRPSRFDIHVPGALEVVVTVADNEKLRILLASNVLRTLPQDYKVKLDEHRDRLDVDIHRVGKDGEGKAALFVHISLPARYCENVELTAVTDALRLSGVASAFEFDGKAKSVYLENVKGTVALNCSADMDIHADEMPAVLEVNQISATSVLNIPRDAVFFTKIKGKSNSIRFSEDGKPSELPDGAAAEHRVELAGMNAELLIKRSAMK